MLGFTIDTIGIFANAESIVNFNSQNLVLTIIRNGSLSFGEKVTIRTFI